MAQFYAPNFSGLLPLFDGKSAAGGKLYAYRAGSSIPAPLFDEDGVELGSWVSIDSNGCADFLLSSALTYKLVVKDALGATLGEWDNVSATNAPGMTNPLTAEGSLIVGGTAGEPTELPAGSEGQALKIVSGVPAWATDAEGMQNPMTTEGDLIVGSTDGEPSRLGVGAAGQVLTSDGTTASWETPAAPGMSNPMTTAGDLIVGGTDGAPSRLGAGTDGNVLTLSSGAPTWAAPATQPGDHKLLTTSADTSAGYLADKLVAGSNVTLTTQTDLDGVQTIEIAAAGGGGGGGVDISVSNGQATGYLDYSYFHGYNGSDRYNYNRRLWICPCSSGFPSVVKSFSIMFTALRNMRYPAVFEAAIYEGYDNATKISSFTRDNHVLVPHNNWPTSYSFDAPVSLDPTKPHWFALLTAANDFSNDGYNYTTPWITSLRTNGTGMSPSSSSAFGRIAIGAATTATSLQNTLNSISPAPTWVPINQSNTGQIWFALNSFNGEA